MRFKGQKTARLFDANNLLEIGSMTGKKIIAFNIRQKF